MSRGKIMTAIGAVKDQTSIGLAKVGNSASLADLHVAIVKATRHNEYPAEEKHIKEILSLTSYSRSYISTCVTLLSRRLSKTRSWTVALKTLILLQRLLQEGDAAYEQEIFFATRRGTRLLNMSDFRDNTNSNAWDFSAFVRTYALFLDEKLEYKMQNKRGRRSAFGYGYEEEEDDLYGQRDRDRDRDRGREIVVRCTPVREMSEETVFSRMQHLQLLLERFLACRPTGEAKNHRIVMVALYPILKESFLIYFEITETLSILIDRFVDMEVSDCVKVYDIFCRVGKQYDELELFYSWNKGMGIARSSEYPEIERITPKKLEIMDDFIKQKSAAAQSKRASIKSQEENIESPRTPEPPEEDTNAAKAQPPPETFKEEPKEEPKIEEPKVVPIEGDLLDLGDDTVTREDNENSMALALFDGAGPGTGAGTALPWHAFDDEADWETALVESASTLRSQKSELGGGFDTLLLDGMYRQAATNAARQEASYGGGSASSMALGSAGRPAMLALPAPPSSESSPSSWINPDPFAASMAVPPPPYVQMSELEKKQRLLMEEQQLWQQYGSRQGQVVDPRVQPSYYMGGGYPGNLGHYYG